MFVCSQVLPQLWKSLINLHKTVLGCVAICWWGSHRHANPTSSSELGIPAFSLCKLQQLKTWSTAGADWAWNNCPVLPTAREWCVLLLLLTEIRITWELLWALLAYGPSCCLLFLSWRDLENHLCDAALSKPSSRAVVPFSAVSISWSLLAQWVPDSVASLKCYWLLWSNHDLFLH